MPAYVVTKMSKRPDVCAGATAMIWVSETTTKLKLSTPPLKIRGPFPPPLPPKVTFVAPVKPLPVITTVAVPLVVPLAGDTADIVGRGAAV